MNNKKGLVKYLILSLLIFIVFIVGINAYSNILKNKLTYQVRVTLSEVAYQNKMVVESQISEQRNLVQELALVLNSEETLINDHVLEIIKKIYEAGDYKNIGIVTSEKTVYISSNGEFTIEEKDYFEDLEDKESLIILDNDTINNQYSIFISEPVTSINGDKGCLFFSYDLKLLVSKTIPDNIVQLTGITQEEIKQKGISLYSALQKILSFVDGEIIVCHNVAFDLGFIQSACKKVQLPLPKNAYIDTRSLARIKLKGIADYQLKTIAEYFSIDIAGIHRALKDCHITYGIYKKLNEM